MLVCVFYLRGRVEPCLAVACICNIFAFGAYNVIVKINHIIVVVKKN